ncbi:DDE-type integrase/transposase/recombinase [Dactylosporangium sp. NPDC049140]|uniref:DDE-type integrase/transposase/recombinase n=1 Tax=Dactylosporangium sp. NPDC049140 TaxID=3155647 RepID=UPI0033C1E837
MQCRVQIDSQDGDNVPILASVATPGSVALAVHAAPICPAVLDELVPSAWHRVERHANNRIEADHSQLKHRLRPMRGPRTDRAAQVIIAGHAFRQNLRRGHTNSDSTPTRPPSLCRVRRTHPRDLTEGS